MTHVPADHEFFFAVGSPDLVMSSVWRVWTWPGKSDIYISEKGSVGSFKVSLHQDGRYRIAFAQQFVREQLAKGNWSMPDRAIDEWMAPEIRPGLQMLFAVLIPASELRPAVPRWSSAKPIVWLPAPATDSAYEVQLYLGNTRVRDAIAIHRPDGTIRELWKRSLPDGWVLIVCAIGEVFGAAAQQRIDHARRQIQKRAAGLNPALFADGRLRVMAQAVTDEGYRQFIDMALDLGPELEA